MANESGWRTLLSQSHNALKSMARFSPLFSTLMQGNLPTRGVLVQHQGASHEPQECPSSSHGRSTERCIPMGRNSCSALCQHALLRWELTDAQQASSGSCFIPAHHRGHQAYSEGCWRRAVCTDTPPPPSSSEHLCTEIPSATLQERVKSNNTSSEAFECRTDYIHLILAEAL